MERTSRSTMIGPEPLDKVKFLCRGFWSAVFDKNISRLQTNQKDFFVLTENEFSWVHPYLSQAQIDETNQLNESSSSGSGHSSSSSHISQKSGGDQGGEELGMGMSTSSFSSNPLLSFQLFLYAKFITGLVSGALENLGLNVRVMVDYSSLPSLSISIRLRRNL